MNVEFCVCGVLVLVLVLLNADSPHLLVVSGAVGRQRPASLQLGKLEHCLRVGLLGGGAASAIALDLAKFERHAQGRSLVWSVAARVGKHARCSELGDQKCRRSSDVEVRAHDDQTTTAAASSSREGGVVVVAGVCCCCCCGGGRESG